MIYLIGGPARCGKSVLAEKLRHHIDGQVLSGDAINRSLRGLTTPEWLPDLFEHVVDPLDEDDAPQTRIDRLRRRDKVLWQFLTTYFEASDFQSDDDILVDGALWPDFMAGFEREHRAAFLVDTSPDHVKRIMEIRDSITKNNWMSERKYTDEKIVRWADFNVARSRQVIELCNQYGYPFFDIADGGIDQAQARAFEYLLER